MRKLTRLYIGLTVLAFTFSTIPNAQAIEPVVLTIGNKTVGTNEFKYVYNKNNANSADAYTEKSLRDYLDLYIKFRLKVKEAEEMGLDTAKSFITEFGGYKKQLAQPYLTEKSVTDKLVKEAYARLQEEVKAAHILVRVSADAEPKDTLIAYNKILDIRKRILAGESFEELAKKYSEDPSAKNNGGSLGYFTALQMVYPFEEGAYKTPVGQISLPVRTRFGYHVIKVADRRKAQGEIKTAHIMIRYSAGTSPVDSLAAQKKINEIYAKLKSGTSWDMLCYEFSEDVNSKSKGGELPPFSTGNMLPSYEEVAFRLTEPGQISEPMQTPYGFHVIKLLERKGIQKYEEMESILKSKVAKDSRSDLSRVYLINRLKIENKFTENPKTVKYVYTKADTNLVNGKFNYDANAKLNKQVLFTIGNKKYTANDFFNYIKNRQKGKVSHTQQYYMSMLYKDFVNESLLAYEEANLDTKYEDYRMLVKEYRDGILLFTLMDSKVWTKAIEDTAGLKKYYQDNQQKYMWGRRNQAVIYNCKDKKILETVKSQINNTYFEVSNEKGDKISYDLNKSDLKPTELKKADAIINVLGRDKNYLVEVTGAMDKTEKAGISKQRVANIVKYLISKGIEAEKIVTKDMGTGVAAGKKTASNKTVSYRFISGSIRTLEKSLNESAPLTLQIKEGKFQVGDDAVIDSFDWKVGFTELQKNDRFYLIHTKATLEAQPKTFEEARGLVISDYQNYLEKEWIESLKKKYQVVVNEEELKKMVKK